MAATRTMMMMMSSSTYHRLALQLFVVTIITPLVVSFSASPNSDSNNLHFSLSAYEKARAKETALSLDASRMHFQILFVDNDNSKGRIAEGLLQRIAEYNDGLFVLFPASATIENSPEAPMDAAAPSGAVRICTTLNLCDTIATSIGSSFDLHYLDEYDLIITLNDEIRSRILRSCQTLEDQEYYSPKCRLLSEFLSSEFCYSSHSGDGDEGGDDECHVGPDSLLRMLEPDLAERVEPLVYQLMGRSSAVFDALMDNRSGGGADQEEAIAAMVLATTGLTKFALDTIDCQLEHAFWTLLEKNFPLYNNNNNNKEVEGDDNNDDMTATNIPPSWEIADAQLRKCSFAITGYFSPQQRKARFEKYIAGHSSEYTME